MPRIRSLQLLEGARRAAGVTVVIDVFRAFSVAPLAIAAGAVRIHPVATPRDALLARKRHPDWLLIGERDGQPLPGFDFGNSPADIMAADLTGRVLVQRTSAGIQGLLAAGENSDVTDVITGSFVNARALVDYVRSADSPVVSLVAMGWNAAEPTLDDELCAGYLAAGIRDGVLPGIDPIRDRLRSDPCGAKFFDDSRPWFKPADFDICLTPSTVDSVLGLGPAGTDGPVLSPVAA